MRGALIGAIVGALIGLGAYLVMLEPGMTAGQTLPDLRLGIWSLFTLNGSFPAGVFVFPAGLGLFLGFLGSRRGKPHF